MPYSRLPRVLVKDVVSTCYHADGISSTLSPATIVTGCPKSDYRTMSLEFGTYVQVYDGTSNDTKSRTLGAIATNPTGNTSGDYYFMSLATGHCIHRRSWILPISDASISRVEAIAFDENMPLVSTERTLSEYDPDALVDLSECDRTYAPLTVADAHDDHHLTTDAYTDESDNDNSLSAADDTGHHPDFDDVVAPPIPPIIPAVDIEERPVSPAVDTNETNTTETAIEIKDDNTTVEMRSALPQLLKMRSAPQL